MLSSLAFFVGLATALPSVERGAFYNRALANETQSGNITTPATDGGLAWGDAYSRVSALVARMTLEEKVTLVTGQNGRCAGNVGPLDSLDVPYVCLQDGPAGVRPATGQSQWPQQITLGATWDRDLIYKAAAAMGKEFYDLGVHIALAPVTGGPIGRSPRGGRQFENYVADPYATGMMGYQSIKGIQSNGVAACAKHFLAYEQETYRNLYGVTASYSVFPASEQLPISSNVDDKTTKELYLWPFADAVRAGTAFVMSAYNEVNNTHACHNSYTQNGLLKTELNFKGGIISDWGGVWADVESSVGGLDVLMPGLGYGGALGTFWGPALVELVQNNTVPESRIDDQVIRLFMPLAHLGQFDTTFPSVPFDAVGVAGNITYRDVQSESSLALIKKIGEEGAVLLKNTGGLPLKKPKQIAILGTDAGPNILGQQSCGAFGDGCPIYNNNGTLSAAFGSGYSYPHNLVTPLEAIGKRAIEDDSLVQYVLNNTAITQAQAIARTADVTLVFANTWTTEGQDRLDLELTDSGAELILAAASVSSNVVVVLHLAGAANLETFADHPNITAILAPLLPGEQSGNSLVSLLYGEVSPSGKLPFTLGKSINDYPPNGIVQDPVYSPQSDFTEKLAIDYRWFDVNNIEPRYEFGFGLSYSTFEYSSISMDRTVKADTMAIQATAEPYFEYEEGRSLYDTIATVSVDIKNTGDVGACEVAQLYVDFSAVDPEEPPRVMRGFEKVKDLAPGATQTVYFPLRRKDLSLWSVENQMWKTVDSATIYVGSSSRKLPLKIEW